MDLAEKKLMTLNTYIAIANKNNSNNTHFLSYFLFYSLSTVLDFNCLYFKWKWPCSEVIQNAYHRSYIYILKKWTLAEQWWNKSLISSQGRQRQTDWSTEWVPSRTARAVWQRTVLEKEQNKKTKTKKWTLKPKQTKTFLFVKESQHQVLLWEVFFKYISMALKNVKFNIF